MTESEIKESKISEEQIITDLKRDIAKLQEDFKENINNSGINSSVAGVEEIRVKFLGKSSLINRFFVTLKTLSFDRKKLAGDIINSLRQDFDHQIETLKKDLLEKQLQISLEKEQADLTLPARSRNLGVIHPLSKVIIEIKQILSELGFDLCYGCEIEDDFHNFTALNIPKHHPARQMQDTFYLANSELLLRTHTSNVQIRQMKNAQPPFRVASVGKVFRADSDQTHTPMFHQLEGLLVDENINFSHLKWVIEQFLQKFFEVDNLKIRLRPSFFPFTEPSAEVDIGYKSENGTIKIGDGDKFLEILGCGMVHPAVLDNCNIDSAKYSGFAFGIGIERLAMLKYGVNDLRMFFENDLRFLSNYGFASHQF